MAGIGAGVVAHVSMADPCCSRLHAALAAAALAALPFGTLSASSVLASVPAGAVAGSAAAAVGAGAALAGGGVRLLDDDGLLDGSEGGRLVNGAIVAGTSPLRKDTDGDGLNDRWESEYPFVVETPTGSITLLDPLD